MFVSGNDKVAYLEYSRTSGRINSVFYLGGFLQKKQNKQLTVYQ